MLINRLQFNKIEVYNCGKSEGLKHTNVLVWSGIRSAIPAHLKNLYATKAELESSLEFYCGERILTLLYPETNIIFMNCFFFQNQESQGVC